MEGSGSVQIFTIPDQGKTYGFPDLEHYLLSSVGDPNPHVLWPPGSGFISHRYGSVSGSFPFLINVLSGLKKSLQNKILTQNFGKKLNISD
jgi:hypothetical protein